MLLFFWNFVDGPPNCWPKGRTTELKMLLVYKGVSLEKILMERLAEHFPEGRKTRRWLGMNNEKMSCGVENGFRGIPGLEEFSSLNDSAAFPGTESRSPGVGSSCTFEEFQQFDSFFPKFISVAREFFLPPERQQFGLVSKRSLLSSLGCRRFWFMVGSALLCGMSWLFEDFQRR
ncbi:hypothetical protein L1049_022806 [Liquidambar formosana]|uniref:Uncharacterized protein n=1 Tax=Liquidambar formosana TaxID=63359 RepID=A0AAP0RD06_LIQFO